MGHGANIYRILKYAAFAGAGAFIWIDSKMSLKYMINSAGVEDKTVATVLCVGLAIICSLFGGVIVAPHSWEWIHEQSVEIARIPETNRRLSRLFGSIVAAVFLALGLFCAYGFDFVSVYNGLTVKTGVASVVLSIIVIFGSDLCLFLANHANRQRKVSEKSEREFDAQVRGYSEPRTVNTSGRRLD